MPVTSEKVKLELIKAAAIILPSVLSTIAIFYQINKSQMNNLTQKADNNARIAESYKGQALAKEEEKTRLKEELAQATAERARQDEKVARLKAQLDVMPAPMPVKVNEAPGEVQKALEAHYETKGMFQYDSSKMVFTLQNPLMGQIANDAVNWKINYPVYEAKLTQTTRYASSLETNLANCDKQREAQAKLFAVSEEQKEKWRLYGEEKDKESTALRGAMVKQERKSKMEKVLWGGAALLGGFFIGKSVK